jgi:hypothetical protein
MFGDEVSWVSAFRQSIESSTAFRNLDAFIGNASLVFQQSVMHPRFDAY